MTTERIKAMVEAIEAELKRPGLSQVQVLILLERQIKYIQQLINRAGE